ncbi:inner membrane-spanning protein YciB [Phenylobacterium sp.]|jgi:intracellular septation protein A|uniref:inner membrane-spanning protein YciB n=1 Tax=Phenylobacterium sp. TaxID=1871053 RepID=UPI002F944ED5
MRNLLYAARPLANDLASSVFFAVLLVAGASPAAATVCAVAFGVLHVGVMLVMRRPVAPLQWASLGLVLVFGAASFFTQDVRFLMAKPSLIYLALAAVMLKRGWMLRYLPPVAAGHGEGLMIAFGYVWAGLMALTAAANLVVAIWFAEHWPLYKAVFPISSKLALFAVQYLTIRAVVKPKVMAQLAAQAAQAAQAA